MMLMIMIRIKINLLQIFVYIRLHKRTLLRFLCFSFIDLHGNFINDCWAALGYRYCKITLKFLLSIWWNFFKLRCKRAAKEPSEKTPRLYQPLHYTTGTVPGNTCCFWYSICRSERDTERKTERERKPQHGKATHPEYHHFNGPLMTSTSLGQHPFSCYSTPLYTDINHHIEEQ